MKSLKEFLQESAITEVRTFKKYNTIITPDRKHKVEVTPMPPMEPPKKRKKKKK